MPHNLFGITGWKNSGKTTLTERLVTELTSRGWKISTIKHAHHNFDIDHEGTDSWRHRKAGATEVAIVSQRRFAIMHEHADGPEPSLAEIAARLAPCDLVLIEGYKREPHRKIEVRRQAPLKLTPLANDDSSIVAIVADHAVSDTNLPVFDMNAIKEIADFIETESGLRNAAKT